MSSKKSKKSTPIVFRHYNIPDNPEGSFKAKCKHCGTTISGSTKATSNFLLHIKVNIPKISSFNKFSEIFFEFQRKHELVYKEIQETPRTDASEQTGSSSQSTLHHLVCNPKKYNTKDYQQVETMRAVVSFIAGNLLPLSTVDSPYFHHLMEVSNPRYQVPSRKHLSTKLLPERKAEIQERVKNSLQRAEIICVTVDLWSIKSANEKLLWNDCSLYN